MKSLPQLLHLCMKLLQLPLQASLHRCVLLPLL
jgi:hypothetical protein